MVSIVVNTSTSGDVAPGAANGGPVATAIAVVRKTAISCTLGDAYSAQTSYGWDQVSGSARILLPYRGGTKGDGVTLSMGAGNNAQCFVGTLREWSETAFPHRVTHTCKGPLYAIEEYRDDSDTFDTDSGRPGIAFEDLVGTTSGATLQQIVTAVLDRVGISYSLSNFDNPSHVYGLLGPEKMTWVQSQTAASYLGEFFKASAGYRLFDSADGHVYLKQITASPSGTDATFTLGKDIYRDSTAANSNLGRQPAVLVTGYDDGSGPARGSAGTGSAFRINSEYIEQDAFAQEIANFWQPQVDRDQVVVHLVTPRDDLLGPASTITVDGFGDNNSMWIKNVVRELQPNGSFRQTLTCVTGGS